MENSYPAAREEAKRLARTLGHRPGRFEEIGFGGNYGANCTRCRAGIYAGAERGVWTPYGWGTTERCPKEPVAPGVGR